MRRWRLLPFERLRAPENMAADEAVFLSSRDRPTPTIRFYAWSAPAVSVGRFQRIGRDLDLAACRRNEVDVVRRPTGGKAVLHGQDWTYAVAGLAQHDGFPADMLGTYLIISRCLMQGLAAMGIDAQAAEEGRAGPGAPARAACFSAPSRHELLVGRRKVCGSAQVRSHGAFLQHGSLLMAFDASRTAELLPQADGRTRQIDGLRRGVTSLGDELATPPDMETLCRIMKGAFEAVLDIRLEEQGFTLKEEALKARLLREKYTDDRWNLEGGRDTWI